MIFPKPQKTEYFEEKYVLKKKYDNYNLLSFFNETKNGNEDITININTMLSTEEYIIVIDNKGISISASGDVGIYRAATSLRQLIKKSNGKLNYCKIEDKPQFERRGYMLDISRCRMPKLDTIKKLIDFLSELKYNEFQLYMEGDCFKYSSYPQYTSDFDCLGPEEIIELNKYCNERYIDLVPNQNSFGHLANWLKRDEFRHLALCNDGENGDTINPLLKESYEFIDSLYGSLLPYFNSQYVNIGLDEAYGLGKYQMEEYCKKYGKTTAFMEWLNKLSTLAKTKYNKKVMFWGDMVYNSENAFHMIPDDAVVLEWGYELIQSQMMTEHCMKYKEANLNYYVCPSTNTHMSFTGRSDVTTFNIRTSAEIGAKFGAKGLLLTDWGNGEGHPHFAVWSLVPGALAGQYAWNIGAEQDGESFKADFIRNAEKFVDETFFGGVGVSRLMYRMSNYYLLEPERVHVGTMCGQLFRLPLKETQYAHLYNLKDSGDKFYFDNVSNYVKSIILDVEKLDFDNQLKREIIINSRMVILSSEICKLRLGYHISNDEIDDLIAEIDFLSKEYYELWCMRNYEKGVEDYLNQLSVKRDELMELKSAV